MGFWEFVGKAINTYDDLSGNAAKRERQEKKRAEQYKKYSLSCKKCGGLAGPIPGTETRYRCGCGHQFAGAKHPY